MDKNQDIENEAWQKCLQFDPSKFNGRIGWGQEHILIFDAKRKLLEIKIWIHHEQWVTDLSVKELFETLKRHNLITDSRHYLEFLNTFQTKYHKDL